VVRIAVENTFREKTTRITRANVWMYSAARNCTEHRVDGATQEILFVLETCSELMLPLASLTQCLAMPAPEYPSANPNLRNLQPWLYFQQQGSPDSSLPPPGDAN
jgi:hypothetical protein